MAHITVTRQDATSGLTYPWTALGTSSLQGGLNGCLMTNCFNDPLALKLLEWKKNIKGNGITLRETRMAPSSMVRTELTSRLH